MDLLDARHLLEVLEAFRPTPHQVYGLLPNRKHLSFKVELIFEFVRRCLTHPQQSVNG